MAILAITIGLNFYLFTIIPKGFFPVQDEGRMQGGIARRPEHLIPVDAEEVHAVRAGAGQPIRRWPAWAALPAAAAPPIPAICS